MRCEAAYTYFCQDCIIYLNRRPHPRKMSRTEVINEVKSWSHCERGNLPVPPPLWAARMGVLLSRKVYDGEIGRIAELIGEAKAKYPVGKGLKP
jgi:hypothetical protein